MSLRNLILALRYGLMIKGEPTFTGMAVLIFGDMLPI
jgi:hypothetical protein